MRTECGFECCSGGLVTQIRSYEWEASRPVENPMPCLGSQLRSPSRTASRAGGSAKSRARRVLGGRQGSSQHRTDLVAIALWLIPCINHQSC